jgi:hypothetical protein
MRLFFRRRIPEFDHVLLVESGSREIFDRLLPGLTECCREGARVDLVTCYAGVPEGFGNGAVYRVTDYAGPQRRAALCRELAANRYTILGMICSEEPIMTKWKWWLAWRLPVKVFVVNENVDYFWLDYSQWKTIRHFILFRAGLSDGGAVRTIGRLLLFPITLFYLLLYAGVIHLCRKARI